MLSPALAHRIFEHDPVYFNVSVYFKRGITAIQLVILFRKSDEKCRRKKRKRGCNEGEQNLRPGAGAAGDLFPGRVVDLIEVLLNGKFLAARRAAKCHRTSAEAELDFLAADLALH